MLHACDVSSTEKSMSGVLCAVVGAVFVTSCSICDGVGSLSEHDMSRSEAMIVSAVGIIFFPPPPCTGVARCEYRCVHYFAYYLCLFAQN